MTALSPEDEGPLGPPFTPIERVDVQLRKIIGDVTELVADPRKQGVYHVPLADSVRRALGLGNTE